MIKRYPIYKQHDSRDCGPACLRMIAKYYGKNYSLQLLREKSSITNRGVNLLGISNAAEEINFRTIAVKINFDKLQKEAILPAIVHWKQEHFVVVYKVTKSKVFVADPGHGLLTYSKEEFNKYWISSNEKEGIVLLLEPTPEFYTEDDETLNKLNISYLLAYLRPYKNLMIQLAIGLGIGSLLQLIAPILMQAIVDNGINKIDLNFIQLILIAQLFLFISRTSVEYIRSWILLHISTRINISLISDFLFKLMKLPIGFFDIKLVGDLLQRINDHNRIEAFLTSTTLNILFSMANLFLFGIVLAYYNITIFLIFILGSILYFIWIYQFMKRRKDLDYKRFNSLSENQSKLIQLFQGMQEIKLNNCEKEKRWEWEKVQAKLFRINIKSLVLEQGQQSGAMFVSELKNILITFFAAQAVILGDMTLGMMLAVQYIIGQLNTPIEQMIQFLHTYQDAKISLERLGEIHEMKDEETEDNIILTNLPETKSINISNLGFQYDGSTSEFVLKDINLSIPENKVTAIVGASGSGKTTLIKLLLGFYKPVSGEIKIGSTKLENISKRLWREKVGVVMQDGFIFSDSIERNIAITEGSLDREKLINSVKTANLDEYIESLLLGFKTKIGMEGQGLSQGQKQRLLITRAVYKEPEYLFFDEATNALDAENERKIVENLNQYFKGKTVIVVAHRLSTVKNADQIVVLDKGKVAEVGTHNDLTLKKGRYYNLVKNQLELGN